MNRDTLIRERALSAGSWPALLLVYGILVGALFASAMAITA